MLSLNHSGATLCDGLSRREWLRIGELMPKTAKLTDRIAVLRAMATDDNAHSSSDYWMLTGYPHSPKNNENALPGAPNDWPSLAAVEIIGGMSFRLLWPEVAFREGRYSDDRTDKVDIRWRGPSSLRT